MKVHHLNVATLCPMGGFLIHGGDYLDFDAKMVAHALLVESNDGLILIDTGFGMGDIEEPEKRFSSMFLNVLRPTLDYEETALYQIKKLGFKPEDVRHIIPTHLDLDHAGGLPDFSWAQVHVFEPERRAALNRQSMHEMNRYCSDHFSHGVKWQTYENCGEKWHGFEGVRAINGLPEEIFMLPVTGHTSGHQAIAVETESGTLLHCGDAYFYHGELNEDDYQCPWGLRFFQGLVAHDNDDRLKNLKRLQQLAKGANENKIEIFCAHDPIELHQMQMKAR